MSKHPYRVGDTVSALWNCDAAGTCLVPAKVARTFVDETRTVAPFGVALTFGGKEITCWVKPSGVDVNDYIHRMNGTKHV